MIRLADGNSFEANQQEYLRYRKLTALFVGISSLPAAGFTMLWILDGTEQIPSLWIAMGGLIFAGGIVPAVYSYKDGVRPAKARMGATKKI